MKKKTAVWIVILFVIISCTVYAENNEINGAYGFYASEQIKNYCEGAQWDENKIPAYIWKDINDETLLSRSVPGYQYDAFYDIREALIAELRDAGDDTLSVDDDGFESDFGKVKGNVPEYSSYLSDLNGFVKTALEECGESEDEKYSDCVKYNRETGFSDGIPWSCTFVCWTAKQSGLLEGTFGPARALSEDLYNDLKGKSYEDWPCSGIEQWSGTEYRAVPGDIVFWKGQNDEHFTRTGIVTETGIDYIVITQGNTLSGHVLPVVYREPDEEMTVGRIVHVIYPDFAFNGEYRDQISGFLKAQGFNESVIHGIIAVLDANSGLIPYRREEDKCSDNAYAASYQYTSDVDKGKITKAEFTGTADDLGNENGYGLAMVRSRINKEILYDLSKKRGTSVGDPETQMIVLTDIWKKEMISLGRARTLNDDITVSFLESIGFTDAGEISLYDYLMSVPDDANGIRLSENALFMYFEKNQNTDYFMENSEEQ